MLLGSKAQLLWDSDITDIDKNTNTAKLWHEDGAQRSALPCMHQLTVPTLCGELAPTQVGAWSLATIKIYYFRIAEL